ncbi:MAG: hypothetical protein KatS3mg061_2991 [Dehalococcoidia bacterium]|nr:MAG: hypothetical protein KatS3mg061_2991 [Dehalococcoidia bacterium]
MKAVYVREFGPIEAMELADLPIPTPGPRQVLVRVKASGVNFAETRMRAGTYSGQTAPFVLGMEAAGIVEVVGSEVTEFQPGATGSLVEHAGPTPSMCCSTPTT